MLEKFSGWKAKQYHIHEDYEPLTVETALKKSSSRAYILNDNDFGNRKNTVFDRPSGFRLCQTDDPENSELIISSQPVKTFLCEYDDVNGFLGNIMFEKIKIGRRTKSL